MVPFGFGAPCRTRPAHVQGNREKAADGIRTHDLLHGNGQGHLGAAPHNYRHLRRFWALLREQTHAAIRSDMRGYAGFWALLARSAQNSPSRFQCADPQPRYPGRPSGYEPESGAWLGYVGLDFKPNSRNRTRLRSAGLRGSSCPQSSPHSGQRPVRDEPLLTKSADGGDSLVVAVVMDQRHVGRLGCGRKQQVGGWDPAVLTVRR